MPAISGIYYAHPQTSEPGLWIGLAGWGGNAIIGQSQTQIESLRPGGAVATRLARFGAALQAALQAACEERTPLADLDPDLSSKLAAQPEPFCRIEGTDLIVQPVVVTITPLSLNPVRFEITVSEGASRSEIRYG